jgi:hypothetical protein
MYRPFFNIGVRNHPPTYKILLCLNSEWHTDTEVLPVDIDIGRLEYRRFLRLFWARLVQGSGPPLQAAVQYWALSAVEIFYCTSISGGATAACSSACCQEPFEHSIQRAGQSKRHSTRPPLLAPRALPVALSQRYFATLRCFCVRTYDGFVFPLRDKERACCVNCWTWTWN